MSALPRWIAETYLGKVGRDHLGLQSVSQDQILPSLATGVNVLTVHPRYYSFYTFLLDEFWKREELLRHRAAWVKFYRPREFAFAVGAHLCDREEHGDMATVVGHLKINPLITRGHQVFNTSYDYIDSDLGGYGLYYRSVAIDLGLILPGGPGFSTLIDVPTERGRTLAAAFREAVQDTDYYRQYFDQDNVDVPRAVLLEYIRSACLCQLQRNDAPDRPLLHSAFVDEVDSWTRARRASFRLFLDLADQTIGYAIDQDSFRQLIYFGETDDGAIYLPSSDLETTYQLWRAYQAREYYAFALGGLFYHLCDWSERRGGVLHPISVTDLDRHLVENLDFAGLAARFRLPDPELDQRSTIDDAINWLYHLTASSEATFDSHCPLSSPLHEHRLYSLALQERSQPDVMVAGMVTLLLLVAARFANLSRSTNPDFWQIAEMGGVERLGVERFLRDLRRQRQRHTRLGDFVSWLVHEYVIYQHLRVAASKYPEHTFRFELASRDSLTFTGLPNTLTFADSRFDALSTHMHELGWCGDFRTANHSLTTEGRKLLESHA